MTPQDYTGRTTDFDVVLFGPTGVTGREVARHLARRAPELGLTWAVAGRDRSKIEETLTTVGAEPAEILHADATDPETIEAMVARTKAVADLVGPFVDFGEPVYAACARAGVHSIDPCGETDWVRQMIDRYDHVATDSGAVIVPTAGFEALPFDLGSLYAAHRLHDRTGDPVVSVDVALSISSGPVRTLSDAVSGGTYTSGVALIERGGSQDLTDPHLLDTTPARRGARYDLRPRKHGGTGRWLAPLFPSPYLNPAVVHRSASLLRDSGDSIYAETFCFQEGTTTDTMVPGPLAGTSAAAMSVASVGMGLLSRLPVAVRGNLAGWLRRVGPKPGEGPRTEDLDLWSYRLDVRAVDARGATEDVVVEADGHPGYKSTATMLGEAALALADPTSGLPEGAGFLTPATALGLVSLERLQHAGLRFRPA